jgi:hypothetical protein
MERLLTMAGAVFECAAHLERGAILDCIKYDHRTA